MRAYLKVKSKTLAAEARIIRLERQKARAAWRRKRENTSAQSRMIGLDQHRRGVVRPEARATCLAYGFLKGRTAVQMEQTSYPQSAEYNKKLWDKIEAMVMKYSEMDERETKQKFAQFKSEWGSTPVATGRPKTKRTNKVAA